MNSARFIFHGELNFFLPRQHKNQPIDYAFNRRASVKDMVEALGVPHPEVQFLLVNDRSVGWNCIVQPGDVVQAFAELNGAGPEHGVALVPPYQGRPRFVLDTHLGRLAGYLRMMGFDTLYRNDYDDEELAHISHHKQRILLTRDIGLLKRSIVIYGYYVRSTQPRQRLAEVIRRYGLAGDIQPFLHCIRCNGLLHTAAVDEIAALLPANAALYYDSFHRCASCGQIYWKGSHYARMERFIEDVRAEL